MVVSYSDIYEQNLNTLPGQNAEFLNITDSNDYDLK